jgi:dienelactone hydrolase
MMDTIRHGITSHSDWDGVNEYEKKRATMLAELGYFVFAADIVSTYSLTRYCVHLQATMQICKYRIGRQL